MRLKEAFFGGGTTIKSGCIFDHSAFTSLLNNLECSVSYEETNEYYYRANSGIDEMERLTAEGTINEARNNSKIVLECFPELQIIKQKIIK